MTRALAATASPAALEPLQPLARFSLDWAHTLCHPGHGCLPYHRAWSAIRLFDQQGASPQGWGFLQRELRRLAGDRRRVLVSGCADTGLMAIVASAFPDPSSGQIVVADRCETTLQQNLLFARHLKREVELHRGDIRSLACEPVDAIVGHSFLNYFDDAQCSELMGSWMRALRPGGVLLLSNRLSRGAISDEPGASGTATSEASPEERPRRLAALRDYALSRGWSEHDCDRLADAAQAFWAAPARRRLSEAAVRQALTQAGFEQIRVDYPHTDDQYPGPRSVGKSKQPRAEIVARRPMP